MKISPSAPIPVLLVQSFWICNGEMLMERLLLSITIKSLPAPESLLKVIIMQFNVFKIEGFPVVATCWMKASINGYNKRFHTVE